MRSKKGKNTKKEQEKPKENEDEEEEDVFEVEKVLDMRDSAGSKEYLVSWVGYPPEENQWIREKDAEGIKDLIDKFLKEGKPKKEEKKQKFKILGAYRKKRIIGYAATDEKGENIKILSVEEKRKHSVEIMDYLESLCFE